MDVITHLFPTFLALWYIPTIKNLVSKRIEDKFAQFIENIREFGGEEKVASILHLASLLYYSSVVKMERYNTDGVRNEELYKIFTLIKQNLK